MQKIYSRNKFAKKRLSIFLKDKKKKQKWTPKNKVLLDSGYLKSNETKQEAITHI